MGCPKTLISCKTPGQWQLYQKLSPASSEKDHILSKNFAESVTKVLDERFEWNLVFTKAKERFQSSSPGNPETLPCLFVNLEKAFDFCSRELIFILLGKCSITHIVITQTQGSLTGSEPK